MSHNQREIQEIIADVLRDTGVRLDTDDPVVAMIFAQRRELAKLLHENETLRSEQQAAFLKQFAEHAAALLTASNEMKAQKQQMVAEILQANTEDLAESRVYEKVAARVQKQHTEFLADFQAACTKYLGMILAVSIVIQIVGLILSRLFS